MSNDTTPLSASAAAKRLGISAKALRLYEQQGLIFPNRTTAGYRAYGPDQMLRGQPVSPGESGA
jgi:DNA-binding transcriptional MerR regulator